MSYDPHDPRITAYVFDELDAAEHAAFEQEMRQSEPLRSAVQQVRDTLAALTDELAAEPPNALAAERRVHVEAAIDAAAGADSRSSSEPSFSSRPRLPRWVKVARGALAASLLIGGGFVSGAYWSGRGRPSEEQLASRAEAGPTTSEVLLTAADPLAAPEETRMSVVTSPQPTAAAPVAGDPTTVLQSSAGSAPRRLSARPGPAPGSSSLSPSDAPELSDAVKTVDRLSVLSQEARPGSRRLTVAAGSGPEGLRHAGRVVLSDQENSVQERLTDLRKRRELPEDESKELADHGAGPGMGGDKFDPIFENDFREVKVEPLSTFSIDVDTASYSKVRQYLMQHQTLPRPDAVRIEELINYFAYEYQPPHYETPFAANVEVAACPWTPRHRLVRIGIKGREVEKAKRPTSNLVFLLDVSGSMNEPNKLPLVKHGMKMLVNELGENDRVAIVVYAGAAGLVLPSTSGDRKQVILDALDRLQAGGSTNGAQGIRLAYQTALDHFIQGGVNRVILCSDGDFNVGVTGTDELVRLAVDNAKTGVFLSVLGFGMGNHNDAMMEQISNKGNGNYAFIDTELEARKVLVEQMSGTLVTIAKDVKIQVEFNPTQVAAFRLIGYENRLLAAQDFNDDKKDAGEIGAGHTVTALYEIVPVGAETSVQVPPVDELRYQRPATVLEAAASGELLTLKLRYKQPDGDKSTLLSFPVKDSNHGFGQASRDFRFVSSVAAFGMLLRNSKYRGDLTLGGVLEIATEAAEGDKSGYREEFLRMVAKAKELRGE